MCGFNYNRAMQSAERAKARAKAKQAQNFLHTRGKVMETYSNATAILALDSFLYGAMPTTNTNSNTNTTNSNAKGGNTMENTNSKRTNSKAKAHNTNSKRTNSKAHNTTNSNTTNSNTLPDVMPERCIASYSPEKPMPAQTAAIFRHHIQQALLAISGADTLEKATASICQIYNYLRGDSPLRLEKDGTPKQDNLPRWSGLGSSILFRNFTSGTYLVYTNKPTRNGKVRSVAVAGPLLK